MKEITYFFQGPLSTWHKCDFIIDGIKFASMKQYLMYQKATSFNDFDISEKILKTSDPKQLKKLGKLVHKFDMAKWNNIASSIMFRGNYYKFSQNKRLYDMLLNTAPSRLVEANPYDEWWGIGLDKDAALLISEDAWPGLNVLGLVLTDLRDFFINEEHIRVGDSKPSDTH